MSASQFKLAKPPIIEAWVRGQFSPAAESVWSWQTADELLRSYAEDFSVFEHLPEFTPQARASHQGENLMDIEIRVEPRYLRARDESRSRIIQVGRNEILVVHGRDAEGHYPGFAPLADSFFEAVERYKNRIPTSSIDLVELHYADLIVIPQMYENGRPLADYFVGAPSLPSEDFGSIAGVSWSFLLSCPGSSDMGQYEIVLLPPDGSDGRFRVDWHSWCSEVSSLTTDEIRSRLDATHAYLKRSFKAICQEPVWSLFEEIVTE